MSRLHSTKHALNYAAFIFSGASFGICFVAFGRLIAIGQDFPALVTGLLFAGLSISLIVAGLVLHALRCVSANFFHAGLWFEALSALSAVLSLSVLRSLDAMVVFFSGLNIDPVTVRCVLVLVLLQPVCVTSVIAFLFRTKQTQDASADHIPRSIVYLVGVAIGVFVSGVILLPMFGLDRAIYVAVGMNIVAISYCVMVRNRLALIAPRPMVRWLIRRKAPSKTVGRVVSPPWFLVVLVASFAFTASIVVWINSITIYASSLVYALSVVLTVILCGCFLGYLWSGTRAAGRISNAHVRVVGGLCCYALGLLMARIGLDAASEFDNALNYLQAPAFVAYAMKFALAFVLFVLPASCMYWLWRSVLSSAQDEQASRFCINGLRLAIVAGVSACGAALAGFALYTGWLGSSGMLTVLAVGVVLSAGFLLARLSGAYARVALAFFVLVMSSAAWWLPPINHEAVNASIKYVYGYRPAKSLEPELADVREGRSGVIGVVSYDGTTGVLRRNGFDVSRIDLKNPDSGLLSEILLAFVSLSLAEASDSVFIAGYGSGLSARTLAAADLKRMDIVEPDPVLLDIVGGLNREQFPVLEDPRVSVDRGGVRHQLAVTGHSYDIAILQPPHAWLPQAADYYTLEFWQAVRSRLRKGGIVGQRINLINMDEQSQRHLLKTFYTVFPAGISFSVAKSHDLLLFGATHPIRLDMDRINKLMMRPRFQRILSAHALDNPYDVLLYAALSREQLLAVAADAALITDARNMMEFRTPLDFRQLHYRTDYFALLRRHFSLDIDEYFVADAPLHYQSIADNLTRRGDKALAVFALKQLNALDEERSRAVIYKELWRQFKYEKLFNFYNQFVDWPDETHLLQALALLDVGQETHAFSVVKSISEPLVRRTAQARLLYEVGAFEKLAVISPLSRDEQRWQLVGLAQRNLRRAGHRLAKITDKNSQEIPQLRVLTRYAAQVNDLDALDHWARKLISATNTEAARLQGIVSQLLAQRDLAAAKVVVKHLEALDPSSERLMAIKQELRLVRTLSMN